MASAGEGREEVVGARRRASRAIAGWNPLYFAFVMATGIVSTAAYLLGLDAVGWGLFGINAVAYVVVSALTLSHIARDPRASVRDLSDSDRGVGSFTAVAGTCVLGSQFVVFEVSTAVATGLLVVGSALWFVLTYAVFAGLTVRNVDEPLDAAVDGSWFLAVVGTQSVAVLAGLIAPARPSVLPELLLVALSLYSVGGMFYLILVTLVFYRMTLFPFPPRSATPPYWINMGAVAITTLAGATLLSVAGSWRFLADLRPFLVGFTFFYWAAGTWWIPFLFAVGLWRHTVGGVALPYTDAGYDLRYWAMVFPLGMYAASTHRFAEAASLDAIRVIPRYFVYVAVLAWVAVAVGLARRVLARVRAAVG